MTPPSERILASISPALHLSGREAASSRTPPGKGSGASRPEHALEGFDGNESRAARDCARILQRFFLRAVAFGKVLAETTASRTARLRFLALSGGGSKLTPAFGAPAFQAQDKHGANFPPQHESHRPLQCLFRHIPRGAGARGGFCRGALSL